METKALLFDCEFFRRHELARKSGQELYEMACDSDSEGYDHCEVLTLDELSERVNDDGIDLSDKWLFFATV